MVHNDHILPQDMCYNYHGNVLTVNPDLTLHKQACGREYKYCRALRIWMLEVSYTGVTSNTRLVVLHCCFS